MQLRVGCTYRDRWGEKRDIMGPTKNYPGWVWTNQGVWYDQQTGRIVRYDPDRGQHYVCDSEWYALKELVSEKPHGMDQQGVPLDR